MAQPTSYDPNVIEIKSKFESEFRRFNVDRTKMTRFDAFSDLVRGFFRLPPEMHITMSYTDPRNSDLLPINNDDNLQRAFSTAMPLLRVFIYREQESMFRDMSQSKKRSRSRLFSGASDNKIKKSTIIGVPQDFRRVSSIVDADLLPDTVRRVKLLKHSSDRPLGFYIRDGTSVRVTPYGLEKVPGIFISRLVPGGLAEGTGLLAVNDEILEVNGIEVQGKTLDQVTDMMVANSQNLIITVKPASLPPSTPRMASTKRPSASSRPSPTPLSTSVKKAPLQSSAESLLSQRYASRSQGDIPSATSPSPTQGQSENLPKKAPSSSSLLVSESNGVKSTVTLSQPEPVNY